MPAPLASFAVSTAIDAAKGVLDTVTNALDPKRSKAKATAQDFESMFLEQALDRLTASSGTDGPLGENGTGGSVYRSLLVKEHAGAITKAGGVGIADQVYRELIRLQEGSHAK